MKVESNSIELESYSRLFGDSLGYLFLVADGMGGHRGGKEASRLAIHYFVSAILNSLRWLVRADLNAEAWFVEDLKSMLANAHRELQTQSASDVELQGMGTTLTMAYVAWPRMYVVHAGDTRCYLLREGELRQITRDHTVAEQMMKSGQLDRASVDRSPWANVLVNALGAGASDVFADIYKIDLMFGDQLLLCSDGLNKHVSDELIVDVLKQAESLQFASDKLIHSAIQAGGSDNVTVVLAKFQGEHARDHMRIFAAARTDEKILMDLLRPMSEIETDADGMHVPKSDLRRFSDPTDIPTSDY
jgi:protein phosphatase